MEDNKITAWAVILDGAVVGYFDSEDVARFDSPGGTVVKLTGEMPRKPIERKTTAWVTFGEVFPDSSCHRERLGMAFVSHVKTGNHQTKVEIIVRELSDEI